MQKILFSSLLCASLCSADALSVEDPECPAPVSKNDLIYCNQTYESQIYNVTIEFWTATIFPYDRKNVAVCGYGDNGAADDCVIWRSFLPKPGNRDWHPFGSNAWICGGPNSTASDCPMVAGGTAKESV